MVQKNEESLSKEERFDRIESFWEERFNKKDNLSIELIKLGVVTQDIVDFIGLADRLINK